MIYEIDLLENETLLALQDAFLDLEFVDGNLSNPSPGKRNKICCHGDLYRRLNEKYSRIIHNGLKKFNVRRTSQMYFAEYNKGSRYDYHIDDNPIGGVFTHYSMTCFLNDPSDYEGGELVIKVGNTEIEYKLTAGKALVYPTGLWHKVNPVVSGSRRVFLCWIETVIRDSFMRNFLAEFFDTINDSQLNVSDKDKMEHLRMNLIREYGKV